MTNEPLMTDGQRLGLEQLREIEAASNGLLEIGSVTDPSEESPFVLVAISVLCGNMPRVAEGLPLQEREPLWVFIPADFPFDHPSVCTQHTRWAGFPHVQWKRYLCLYQAPSSEWNASDGMFGFIQRLDEWLRHGALGKLDPDDAPLHPPVAYVSHGPLRTIIPRADTPPTGGAPWVGYAHLRVHSEWRVDLCGWSPFGDASGTPGRVAAAILLPEPLPFEFPSKVSDLITELTAHGISQEMLLLALQCAVLHNEEDAPLYVILGTPMRGCRQDGGLRQHLTAWYLDPVIAKGLRLAIEKYDDNPAVQQIGEKCEQLILEWAREAKVTWCLTREDRPEVTIRRDAGSPLAWFAGRTISLWGCGALGSYIGEFLTRAGVRKLILRDNRSVGPGVLARQLYDDSDIGRPKVDAMRDRLQQIRPDLDIDAYCQDILSGPLSSMDWTDGAELVIDASASAAVLTKLELWRWTHDRRVPVVSLAVGHRAEDGLVLLSGAEYSGGPGDLCRRAKLEACSHAECESFRDEFWPDHARTGIFQPEPGCSENTFVGSAADVAVLTGMMLNHVACDLACQDHRVASAHFVRQPHIVEQSQAVNSPGANPGASFRWEPDHLYQDPHSGYQIRVTGEAWKGMLDWADQSRRRRGRRVETGGLLFGERDDAARVLWVTDISGPPPDSRASAQGFICGVEGTREMNQAKRERSHGSVQYVGMWHTHPQSTPLPSSTDLGAMARLTNGADPCPARVLLLIVGTPTTHPSVGVFLFGRQAFHNSETLTGWIAPSSATRAIES